MSKLIENISDTARWVAIFRAEESERPDAVFHDPFAKMLAGEKGKQIADAVEFSRQNSWSFVARTFLFDQFIMQHVHDGFDMIVNLAAGLDARSYRMELPSSLKWIDVDLPAMIEYKNKILKNEKPKCELKSVSLDLSFREERLKLFEQINKTSEKTLVVAEGLLVYLSYEQVAGLSTDLSSQNHFRRWVFDLASPGLLTMLQKEMGSALKGSGAVFQFAPPEGEGFFPPYGWKHLESKSLLKAAAAVKRLNDQMMAYAAYPEPEGPKGEMPWSGVCLFENIS